MLPALVGNSSRERGDESLREGICETGWLGSVCRDEQNDWRMLWAMRRQKMMTWAVLDKNDTNQKNNIENEANEEKGTDFIRDTVHIGW